MPPKTPASVSFIPISHIEPNPHNPRRLFDKEPMDILRDSIKQLGILVPLDVYPAKKTHTDPKKDKFVLLDGERRWRCAGDLKLDDVPAIIVQTPNDIENILTMFHIHNVREGWQLMPTALKLQTLMEKLKVTNERQLAALTRLKVSQVRRCKILLSYPKKYHDMMLAPPSERYKADFFIDLDRFRRPALEEKFKPWTRRGDRTCIDIMIHKYDNEVIKAVTEFRILTSIYRGAQRTNQMKRFADQFELFLSSPSRRIDEIIVPGASFEKEIKTIKRASTVLRHTIEDLNLENISGNREIIASLKSLVKLINSKLEDALLNSPNDTKS